MALKLTVAKSNGQIITLDKIPIGMTFFGDHVGKGVLFLRIYGGIVSLDNPRNTWTYAICHEPEVTIENYRPVDIVGEVREI